MEDYLIAISKAYDQTVEDYNDGQDELERVPLEFRESEKFKRLLQECQEGVSISNAPDTKGFLNPQPGMNFLDAGCCANLFNYRLDLWGAAYYGIDISNSIIRAMRSFAARENIAVGALKVSEVAEIPFPANFFDIAACVGVLEYVDLPYCKKALKELSRVLKPSGRLIVDLPNSEHPLCETMLELEQYLGRPNIPKDRWQFEALLKELFTVVKCDDAAVMIKYCVTVRK